MEWLGRWTYNLKLKTSFIIYILIFLVIALSFTKIIEILIEKYVAYIQNLYLIEEVIQEGKETITYFSLSSEEPTKLQKKLVKVLEFYREFALTINTFIFSILGFSLYYKDKLKKPMDELRYKELEIQILPEDAKKSYKDEMLQFSKEYSQMLDSLMIEKKLIWQELAEIEQMMASFEHDIRTPVTVIKGYSDMILKYYPEGKMSHEKLEKTLLNIGIHANRLDEYIQRRSSLKSVKELELHLKSIETEKFIQNMKRIGEALYGDKQFKIKKKLQSEYLNLDEDIILEAYENILTNGFRHAKTMVEVNIEEDGNNIIIQIQDDGDGFSKEALKYGTMAFFTENKSKGQNMGLGLNISKELLKKHMGQINLSNNSIGGLVEIKIKNLNS